MAAFAKNESLMYRRISTKLKSSKLFWRILEDNKQNKCKNRGKKTVRIYACWSPSRLSLQQMFWRRNKTNLYKIPSRSIFSNDFLAALFCLDIEEKCLLLPYYTKYTIFSGKMTFILKEKSTIKSNTTFRWLYVIIIYRKRKCQEYVKLNSGVKMEQTNN